MQRRRTGQAGGFIRFLIRMFPFDFRREYGAEMEATLREEHGERRKSRGSVAARVIFWWRALAEMAQAALREHLDVTRRDLRYSMRSLARSPGLTVVVVAALGLGIGASAATFNIADAVLLRPPPVPEPDRLAQGWADSNGIVSVRFRDYVQYRARNRTLAALAARTPVGAAIRAEGWSAAEFARGVAVTDNFFEVMGVGAAAGRTIQPGDDRPDAPSAMVLGDRFWRNRFGADPAIVGTAMTIDGVPFDVVGVMPPGFRDGGPSGPDFWVALNRMPGSEDFSVMLVGRLRSGISLAQAQSDLAAIAAQGSGDLGGLAPVFLFPYDASGLPPLFRRFTVAAIGILMALTALGLLIVCLNVASLLLARFAERRQELHLRMALGAGRMQLARQLLTECGLLSIAGCAVAIAVFAASLPILLSWLPAALAVDWEFFAPGWKTLLFTLGAAVLAVLAFGAAPALKSASADLAGALKDAGATPAPLRSRLRRAFVVGQVAVSTVVLAAAGLLVQALTDPRIVDRAFDADGVLAVTVRPNPAHDDAQAVHFLERLLDRVAALPEASSANLTATVPLTLSFTRRTLLASDGLSAPVYVNWISPGHFRTLHIALLEGRDFDAADHAGSSPVAIVNERLALQFWPGESAIGKRLPGDVEVVGVAGNSKYTVIVEEPKWFMYLPLAQKTGLDAATLLVRTEGGPVALLSSVRAAVEELDPGATIRSAAPLEDLTGLTLVGLQAIAGLAAAMGALALTLAAIGVYGTVSYLARRRTREIGVRIALGAEPAHIAWTLSRQALRWAGCGIGLGMLAAYGVNRALAAAIGSLEAGPFADIPRLLVAPLDASTAFGFAAGPLLIAITVFLACWIPARRASRTDPMAALRDE